MIRVFRTGIDVLAPLCAAPRPVTIPGMRRFAPLLLLPLVLATGCTSHTSRCVNGTCAISLSGEQSVDVALALHDEDRQAFSPMLAILSSRHEAQYSRLFRS